MIYLHEAKDCSAPLGCIEAARYNTAMISSREAKDFCFWCGEAACMKQRIGCGEAALWGSQSWLQPPFRRLSVGPRLAMGLLRSDALQLVMAHGGNAGYSGQDSPNISSEGRLKGGCSHDWLPHE
jgi:hypothetical protein